MRQESVRGILAVGMTFVIISGGIDLSVGSVLALSTVICALALSVWTMVRQPRFCLPVCLCVCRDVQRNCDCEGEDSAFCGDAGNDEHARGLAMAFSHNYTIMVDFDQAAFFMLEEIVFGYIPVPAIIFLITVIVFQILLVYTAFGRNLYAIGSNETAAHLAGVPVDRYKLITYVLCGFLAAAAGVLQAAQMHQGDPKEGVAFELDAIAAVVVGGASLMGGSGNVAGTLVGALLIGMITNVLGLRNVEPSIQKIVIGSILVLAVAAQTGTFAALGGMS